MDAELDRNRISQLIERILEPIRGNRDGSGKEKERLLEALNALGFVTARVLMDCDGPSGNAREFFNSALQMNLEVLAGASQ